MKTQNVDLSFIDSLIQTNASFVHQDFKDEKISKETHDYVSITLANLRHNIVQFIADANTLTERK